MSAPVAAKCPFLSTVPAKFINCAGKSLGMYGQRCPVMSKLFHTAVAGSGRQAVGRGKTIPLGEQWVLKCANQFTFEEGDKVMYLLYTH